MKYSYTPKILFFVFALFASTALAGLKSPFPSAVPGLSIPNAHVLLFNDDDRPLILRGMAPNQTQMRELKDLGIQKILIFKMEIKNEVAQEKQYLESIGYEPHQILHIPFPWKNLHNFHETCQMTVRALQEIESAIDGEAPLFFHCSVGEDRTGYLAGLLQIWHSPDLAIKDVFAEELCARGYEAGNHRKPLHVVSKIRETLSPRFWAMGLLLKQWREDGLFLDPRQCPHQDPFPEVKNLVCQPR
jgi:hypothetical protein